MPQMSPLLWLMLFILFSSILMLMMVKLYFSSSKKIFLNKAEILNSTNLTLNWKW